MFNYQVLNEDWAFTRTCRLNQRSVILLNKHESRRVCLLRYEIQLSRGFTNTYRVRPKTTTRNDGNHRVTHGYWRIHFIESFPLMRPYRPYNRKSNIRRISHYSTTLRHTYYISVYVSHSVANSQVTYISSRRNAKSITSLIRRELITRCRTQSI
jgi:hypothetical protein